MDAFSQTDLQVGKKWNFEKWALDVFLLIQNFFSQQITELESSSVLPSIGVMIDF